MVDMSICEWLLENADSPIRYRVMREILKDENAANQIENELYDNDAVKLWLSNFKRIMPADRPVHETIHGAPDYCLENTMNKMVQFGLNAEMPLVTDRVQQYIDIVKSVHLIKPYRKMNVYLQQDIMLLSNMLTLGEYKDNKLLEFMLGSLDELYVFASKGDCDIYISSAERAKLKNVPPNYAGIRHFTKPELLNENGICWPLIYDIIGLTKLYGIHGQETDKKIDTVIHFVTNDDFHKTIPDGYGILMTTGRTKYYSHGWDPKYPGWFDIADYIENATNRGGTTSPPWSVPKLLFFAMHIVKYPIALTTKWFSDLLCYLEMYKTENNTYIFPKEWLPEKQGYAVLGNHMSFGENRRKKNWQEIESTFLMQILQQYIH